VSLLPDLDPEVVGEHVEVAHADRIFISLNALITSVEPPVMIRSST
jgi:hypothetical protein